jgi:hypothetical protein
LTTNNPSLKDDNVKVKVVRLSEEGFSGAEIGRHFGISPRAIQEFLAKDTWSDWWLSQSGDDMIQHKKEPHKGAKILFMDIETSPMAGAIWQLWDNNVSLNQIERDWYVLSWAAKWAHEDEVMYQDKALSWDDEDDSELLKGIWQLLDEADIIVGQNSKKFDEKKLNARFILNGMKPPSHYRSVDTLEIAKKNFGFTSNKLEYMTEKLCKKYKKLKHDKFPGYELWKECLRGNQEAWDQMSDYNKFDVLALEELYGILRPWYRQHPNLNLYNNDLEVKCNCGSYDFEHAGYHYTNLSKFDRFRCTQCGAMSRGKVNLLSKDKRDTLRMNVL